MCIRDSPGAVKKEAKRLALLKSENSFESIAKEWFENRKHKWATGYSKSIMAVSYTHLDVYKRQGVYGDESGTAFDLLDNFFPPFR